MRSNVRQILLIAGLVALPLAGLTWGWMFQPDANWVTASQGYFGIDFVNFWAGGRIAATDAADAYRQATYASLLHTWFAPAVYFSNFSYPPSLLPWLRPFAALPYLAGLAIWSALGVMAFLVAVLGRFPRRLDAPWIVTLLLAPVLISNLMFGQIALFAAVAFMLGIRLLPTRPGWAGVCIGMLSLKPQLGLLIPVFLLAIGAWTTIATAAATTLALIGLSVVLYGLEPWHLYLTDTAALQWDYIVNISTQQFYAYHMTTPFSGLWLMGVPVAIALKVQGMIAAGLGVTTALAARSQAPWPLKATLLAFGMVMLTPYSLAHDLVVPLAALTWYLTSSDVVLTRTEQIGLGLLWLLPFPLAFVLPMLGVPLVPVVMLAAYAVLLQRAAVAHTAARGATVTDGDTAAAKYPVAVHG